MKNVFLLLAILFFAGCVQQGFVHDGISVSRVGDSFSITVNGTNIYLEPSGIPAGAPVADYIFLSYDDCDRESMLRITDENTTIVGTYECVRSMQGRIYSMGQAEYLSFGNGIVKVSSVPVERGEGDKGNGYYISAGNRTLYFIPDTNSVPLIKQGIDVAFLPEPGSAALLKPKVVVPTMGSSDVFSKALDGSGIQVKAI